MALAPQQKNALVQYTTIAKAIIFNAERMKKFLTMLDTKQGAITAVKTVMGAIEQKKPIPKDITMLLAINIYILMVDMAQDATDMKADKNIVQGVITAIMKSTMDSYGGKTQQPAPTAQPMPTAQAAQPAGLINQGA